MSTRESSRKTRTDEKRSSRRHKRRSKQAKYEINDDDASNVSEISETISEQPRTKAFSTYADDVKSNPEISVSTSEKTRRRRRKSKKEKPEQVDEAVVSLAKENNLNFELSGSRSSNSMKASQSLTPAVVSRRTGFTHQDDDDDDDDDDGHDNDIDAQKDQDAVTSLPGMVEMKEDSDSRRKSMPYSRKKSGSKGTKAASLKRGISEDLLKKAVKNRVDTANNALETGVEEVTPRTEKRVSSKYSAIMQNLKAEKALTKNKSNYDSSNDDDDSRNNVASYQEIFEKMKEQRRDSLFEQLKQKQTEESKRSSLSSGSAPEESKSIRRPQRKSMRKKLSSILGLPPDAFDSDNDSVAGERYGSWSKSLMDREASMMTDNADRIALAQSKNYRFVLDPYGRFVTNWRRFLFPLIIFNCVNVPFRVAFGFDGNYGFFFFLSYFTDIVFIMDIWINTRIGFYRRGTLMMDPKEILKHYVRHGWFVYDVIASFPFDLVQLGYGKILPWTRFNKFIRIFQLFKHLNELKGKPGADVPTIRFVSLLGIALTFVHLCGCGWYVVARFEGLGSTRWGPSLAYQSKSLAHRYLRAVFWVFSMISGQEQVKQPETLFEEVFSALVILGGTLIFAYIVGSVGAVVDSRNENEILHQSKLSYINRFMTIRNIPESLQLQVWHYFTFLWETQRGFDTESIVSDFPSELRNDVYLCLFKDVIRSVPFLQDLDATTVVQIISNMKSVVCAPGQVLCHANDKCERMFVVTQGKLELFTPHSHGRVDIDSTICRGGWYGAHEIFSQEPYRFTLRAKTFSDVFVLTRDALYQVLQTNPGSLEIMQRKVAERELLNTHSLTSSMVNLHTALKSEKSANKLIGHQDETELVISMLGDADDLEKQGTLIPPLGRFALVWDFVTLSVTIYNLIVIPYRFGFDWDRRTTFAFLRDLVVDMVLIADIYVSLHRGYLFRGTVITSRTMIRRRYFQSRRFHWDLITLTPLDIINYFSIAGTVENPAFRLIRLLRIKRMFRTIDTISLRLSLSNSVKKAAEVFCGFLLALHTISAMYFGFTFLEGYGTTTWVPEAHYEFASRWEKYTRALRFSLKVFTNKGPPTLPETTLELLFTNVMIFIGLFVSAYIIGNITSLVANFDALHTAFNRRTVKAFEFLEYRKIPKGIQSRVRRYYDLVWYQTRGVSEMQALKTLPANLHSRMMIYMCWNAIEKAPFFKQTSLRFKETMATMLRFEIIPIGEFVVVKGELGDRMFFVLQGCVEVLLQADGKPVASMDPGSFFGESSILDPTKPDKRGAWIRAKTSCVLATLHKRDVIKLMRTFSDFRKALTLVREKRMKTMQKAAEPKPEEKEPITKKMLRRLSKSSGQSGSPVVPREILKRKSSSSENLLPSQQSHRRSYSDLGSAGLGDSKTTSEARPGLPRVQSQSSGSPPRRQASGRAMAVKVSTSSAPRRSFKR